IEMTCNLDDMTGEALGFASEVLLNAGALDVYTTPIYMKKNRPGVLLTCLCHTQDFTRFAALIFQHTSTRGMRYRKMNRLVLDASMKVQPTIYGDVRIKTSYGNGICKSKPEFDDLSKIANENQLSLCEVYSQL
ncbi:MAG: nickel insertion protein, partial [Lachnospiraceae bacterium]